MAYNNRPMGGFRWRYSEFDPNDGPPIVYAPVQSNYGTALYDGDPVKMSSGYLVAAAAGDAVYGVFAGAERYYDGSAIRRGGSLPANSVYGSVVDRISMARVIPARGQVFEIDSNDNVKNTTQLAYMNLQNLNAEWIAGTHVNDQSGALLDINGVTPATTNTLSLRVVGVSFYPDIDYTQKNVKLLVKWNLIQDGAVGTTTGA